jgi:hypothetical protein
MHIQNLKKLQQSLLYILLIFVLPFCTYYYCHCNFIRFSINFVQACGFTERNGEACAEDPPNVRAGMESHGCSAKSRMGALYGS